MISNRRGKGNETRKILFKDIYRIRGWKDGTLDTIYDIGANLGIFAVMMRFRHPKARVIAVEPSLECLLYLRSNLDFLDIHLEEVAMGNGDPLYLKSRGHILDDMFVEEPNGYMVQTMTLGDLYKKYGGKKYMLKFNCEGGEKYLIGDKASEDVVRNSSYSMFQIHYQSVDTPFSNWLPESAYETWFNETFGETHVITKYKMGNKLGTVQFILYPKKR